MNHKMVAIEEKKRNVQRKILMTAEELRKKEMQRLDVLKQNQEEIDRETQKRNANYLGLTERSKKTPNSAAMKRTHSQYRPGVNMSEDRVKHVQNEAQRVLEEKKKMLNEKMEAFSSRMREKEKRLEEKKEVQKEQARQWSQTLKLNVHKKKRKEHYRKTLLEQKIKSIENKQQVFEEHKKTLMTERFYAKINNEMKDYYVKEAIQEMAINKSWSLEKLEKIMEMFQPKLQDAVIKDKKAILRNINKVLTDPFHVVSKTILVLIMPHRITEKQKLVELFAAK